MRAEEAPSGDHEQRRSRVKDDRPRIIRKQPWWLPVLIAALLGAGICWLMASLIGWLGNDNGTIMNEQTAQTVQYQALNTGNIVKRIVDAWPWISVTGSIIIGGEALLLLLLLHRCKKREEED